MSKSPVASIAFVREVLLAHPTVQERTSHGAPSFKSHGRVVACSAIHKSAERDSLVVAVDKAQRTALIGDEPESLYIVNHYAAYDVVLVRMSSVDRQVLRALLEGALEFVHSRSVMKRVGPKRTAAGKTVGRARTSKTRKH